MADAHVQTAPVTDAGHSGARRRGLQGLDRVVAWAMIAAVALVHWQIVEGNKFGSLHGEFGDTDSYTWMVRATDLMKTGHWFDGTLHRVDPPHGLEQHWTRPLDTLIVGGALVLSPFMKTHEALFLSGTLVSPLLHLIGLAVLLWGAGPLLGRGRVPLLGLLYLTQVGIIGYSAAGRPDHHSLILLLSNAAIVLALRVAVMKPDKRLSLGLGAVMALGLWTGVEMLVTVFGCLLGFGLVWLKDGRRSEIAEKMAWTGIGAFAAGAVALVLQRGGTLFAPAFRADSFSAFHVSLLGVTAAFWLAVRFAERRGFALSTIKTRAALAAGLAGLAGLALALLFPQFLAFNFEPMDPFYRLTRFTHILEFRQLISAPAIEAKGLWDVLSKAVLQVGVLVPSFGFLIWALFRDRTTPRRAIWPILAAVACVMLVVYTAEGGIEFRDAPYLELIALIPYTELCYRIVRETGRRMSGMRRSLVRPFTIMVLLGWYVFPAVAMTLARDEGPSLNGRNACPVKQAAPVLRSLNDPSRLQTVMAFVDFGPEIMYRTPHAILSIPNHRTQPGYKLTWDAMTANSADKAKRLIVGHGVDFVLICDSPVTRGYYGQLGAKNTFRQSLIEGHTPGWLKPVPLPKAATGFHLFRVAPGAP